MFYTLTIGNKWYHYFPSAIVFKLLVSKIIRQSNGSVSTTTNNEKGESPYKFAVPFKERVKVDLILYYARHRVEYIIHFEKKYYCVYS